MITYSIKFTDFQMFQLLLFTQKMRYSLGNRVLHSLYGTFRIIYSKDVSTNIHIIHNVTGYFENYFYLQSQFSYYYNYNDFFIYI